MIQSVLKMTGTPGDGFILKMMDGCPIIRVHLKMMD